MWALHELTFGDFSGDGIGAEIQSFIYLYMGVFGD
ncbi:MAG: hypothetical protein PWP64_1389, partial [Candidatus Cloacimonadota bacterium]|nr:hypothetical protein [Candidatus Cloacimonadota bacterium]